jgi:hypothetical protein
VGRRLDLGRHRGAAGAPTAAPEALATLLMSSRPMVIMAIGGIGLAIIIWLMVVKPF